MIVASLASSRLHASVRRAARPDEDVVVGPSADEALRRGFPRAAVVETSWSDRGPEWPDAPDVPALIVDGPLLERWEADRRVGGPEVPPDWTGYASSRIGMWLRRWGSRPTWVDLYLRDLGRAAGQPLPAPLRGLGRRVLEFPARYPDLKALAGIGGLSAGALKARFRRRGLPSPYSYLRWFRSLAVAHILSDPSVTTLGAAYRVGMSSSGNLSRAVQVTTGLTPTRLRADAGRENLVVGMVEELMSPAALALWHDLAPVFLDVA